MHWNIFIIIFLSEQTIAQISSGKVEESSSDVKKNLSIIETTGRILNGRLQIYFLLSFSMVNELYTVNAKRFASELLHLSFLL